MSVINMYYPNTTCPPGYHHIDFMATGALGCAVKRKLRRFGNKI